MNFLKLNHVLILVFSYLMVFPAQAKMEFLIGLTEQGIRAASIEEVEIGFNYQLEKISKDKKYVMKIKIFPNDEKLSSMLSENYIAGYFGSPLLAIQNKNRFNLDLLFSPVLNDKVMQRYVVLVRKDSSISELVNLKNKSLSYCTTDEVGIMYLQKLIKDKASANVNSFFSKMIVKKNPSIAISSVFFKETQAVIALEADFKIAAELNPQLKEQLTAIETSPEYITNILAITNKVNDYMSEAEYESNVLRIGGALQSKQILKSYNYGKLRKIKREDLISTRDLINDLYENKKESER